MAISTTPAASPTLIQTELAKVQAILQQSQETGKPVKKLTKARKPGLFGQIAELKGINSNTPGVLELSRLQRSRRREFRARATRLGLERQISPAELYVAEQIANQSSGFTVEQPEADTGSPSLMAAKAATAKLVQAGSPYSKAV